MGWISPYLDLSHNGQQYSCFVEAREFIYSFNSAIIVTTLNFPISPGAYASGATTDPTDPASGGGGGVARSVLNVGNYCKLNLSTRINLRLC